MTVAKQKPQRVRTPNKIRRAATRQAVLSAARPLFVQHGYLRTTVDEIASHAGVSKGGVYFHFPDKADIVRELLLQTAEIYREKLAQLRDISISPLKRLIGYTNWVAKLGGQDPEAMLLPILISLEFLGSSDEIGKLVTAHYSAIYRGLVGVIDEGRAKGIFNTRSGAREQAATIILMGDGALLEWLRRGKLLNGTKLVRALRQFILDGMLTQSYRQRAGLALVDTANVKVTTK